MSNYQNKLDFVKRTRKILDNLESKTQYEKTLFLNCCMGLLVAPQQWDNDDKHQIKEEMDGTNWFIDIKSANPNVHKKGKDALSVENFAYHLRNCLCHHLFDVLGDSESINFITIVDYNVPEHTTCSFKLKVSFDSVRKFVLKYSEEKIKLLQTNP